jgi:prevent-host-death family protein
MREIGVRELKVKASEIMRSVRNRRARYIITYRGRPVGLLSPQQDQEPSRAAAGESSAWDELTRQATACWPGCKNRPRPSSCRRRCCLKWLPPSAAWGDAALARDFANALSRLPNLVLVNLDTTLAQQAADAAAQYRLRGSDAVYAVVALRFGSALITLDREQHDRLAKVVTSHYPGDVSADIK